MHLGGYYECPKNKDGKRLGPLVGYAGKYFDPATQSAKQWIGDIYVNFAVLERKPRLLQVLVAEIACKLFLMHQYYGMENFTFCGMPEGGKSVAQCLAERMCGDYIYPEKKVTKIATPTSRETSELVFTRHEIISGEPIFLVEDVLNNFSTTGQAIDLVTNRGGKVIGIIGLLNRSPKAEHHSTLEHGGMNYPIISVCRMPIEEYKQDDERVIQDIKNENVCLNPKGHWPSLRAMMNQYRSTF